MGKPIVVSYEGVESSFDHLKVDRGKLYGRRVRVALDREGRRCERALLSDDGTAILRQGMIAQGYFDDDGDRVAIGKLQGRSRDGAPLPLVPSTLGVAQPLERVDPVVLLDLEAASVHALSPQTIAPSLVDALERGEVFKFAFNYGSDYHAETAVLVKNEHGYFCVVGTPLLHEWSELDVVPVERVEITSDLDFEMF